MHVLGERLAADVVDQLSEHREAVVRIGPFRSGEGLGSKCPPVDNAEVAPGLQGLPIPHPLGEPCRPGEAVRRYPRCG